MKSNINMYSHAYYAHHFWGTFHLILLINTTKNILAYICQSLKICVPRKLISTTFHKDVFSNHLMQWSNTVLNIQVFWDVTLHQWARISQILKETELKCAWPAWLSRRRCCNTTKHRNLLVKWQSVTVQKTQIL